MNWDWLLSVEAFVRLGTIFTGIGVVQAIGYAVAVRRAPEDDPPKLRPWTFASFISFGVGVLTPSLLVQHGVI